MLLRNEYCILFCNNRFCQESGWEVDMHECKVVVLFKNIRAKRRWKMISSLSLYCLWLMAAGTIKCRRKQSECLVCCVDSESRWHNISNKINMHKCHYAAMTKSNRTKWLSCSYFYIIKGQSWTRFFARWKFIIFSPRFL